MSYSKGIMWLDDCRIPFVDETEMKQACKSDKSTITKYDDWNRNLYKRLGSDTKGRFTPNLLVCDDMLNDGSSSQYGKRVNYNNTTFKEGLYGFECKAEAPFMYGDKRSNSRYYDLDLWFDKMIEKL